MAFPTSTQFHSDGPIVSEAEDRLGRARFSQAIGDRLLSWAQPESLVAAIYGDWGSGKSSVKNLILEHVEKRKKDNPLHKFTVTQFNPWQFSGSEQLCQQFFDTLAHSIAELPVDSKSKAAKLKKRSSKRLRLYGRCLAWGGTLMDAATVGAVVGAPPAAIFTKGISVVLNSLGKWCADTSNAISGNMGSLQELKNQLRSDFSSLGYKHLVVIDDVDRVTPDEVCLLFRLVKANSDFPNLVFLLLAQRSSAVKALDEITHGEGERFLEKIVQIPFDLPTPTANEVGNVLYAGINSIFTPLLNVEEWEQGRFLHLWNEMLKFFFGNLRDTYRYLNALAFMASFFKGEHAYEVNAVDLIALETLRVFEPPVYNAISTHKLELFDDDWLQENRSDKDKALKLLLEKILELSSKKDAVKRGLSALFPSFEKIVTGNHYSKENWGETWKRERRVCDPDFFDRYFMVTIPVSQVSESDLRAFMNESHNASAMLLFLKKREISGTLKNALVRIEAENYKKKIIDPRELISALLEIFEATREEEHESLFDQPERAVGIWSREFLLKETDQSKRDQLATDFVQRSDTLFSSLRMVSYFIPMDLEDKNRKIVSDSVVQLIRSILSERIASRSESILDHPRMSFIFWAWIRLEELKAKEWMISKIKDPRQFISVLPVFISTVSSSSGYRTKRFKVIRADSLERITTLDDWKAYAAAARAFAVKASEKEALAIFDRAILRREKGLADDNWDEEDSAAEE